MSAYNNSPTNSSVSGSFFESNDFQEITESQDAHMIFAEQDRDLFEYQKKLYEIISKFHVCSPNFLKYQFISVTFDDNIQESIFTVYEARYKHLPQVGEVAYMCVPEMPHKYTSLRSYLLSKRETYQDDVLMFQVLYNLELLSYYKIVHGTFTPDKLLVEILNEPREIGRAH